MARPKKVKEKTEPKEQSKLYGILFDLHNQIDKADELICKLEGIEENSSGKSLEFCKSYVILLFQEYIKNKDDQEMMLAACGLLEGYKFQKRQLDRRMADYREYAQGHNLWINPEWSANTYSTKYREKIKEIVAQLEENLINEMAKKQRCPWTYRQSTRRISISKAPI